MGSTIARPRVATTVVGDTSVGAMDPTTPSFPLAGHLGLVIDRVDEGRAIATLTIDERHHNPNGVVHGAVVFAMVDTAMGAAAMSMLGDDKACSTIELQVRFLRPTVDGTLTADTRVVKPGRRVMHLDSTVTDASGRVVATATSSFAVLDLPG